MKGAFIFDRCLYSVNVHADTVFIRGLSSELKLLYIRDSKEKEKRMEVKGREKKEWKEGRLGGPLTASLSSWQTTALRGRH